MNKLAVIFVFVALPLFASAHQPRIVTSTSTVVADPQISKAYYGELQGDPHVYHIESSNSFELYVNVLVPGDDHQKKDISFAIVKDGDLETPLIVKNGSETSWKKFFEEYGHDVYWEGAEFRGLVTPGVYDIHVWSSNNDSKYALAIGGVEFFDFKESVNALNLIPRIKREFFETSPATFILSPLGLGYAVFMLLLGAIASVAVWAGSVFVRGKRVRAAKKNLGNFDRWIRAILGFALFFFAIITSWNPILLGVAGYVLCEAAIGWCGLYRLVGRNTCGI